MGELAARSDDRSGAQLRRVWESPRTAGVVLGLVAVQLALSLRFFAEYVGRYVEVAFTMYVVVGVALAAAVLRSHRVLHLVTRPWMLGLAVGSLLVLDGVAYPKADALREVGRGSDQDDCARLMVHNVFEGRAPFAQGYFGDPCSTGPSEFFVYMPVRVWDSYFVLVPALVTLCGFLVLRLVVASAMAVLLSLTQFASWIFLELSAVGSDLLFIGWTFAAAVTASCCGLRRHDRRLIAVGAGAYVLFAGSRVPLAAVAAASLVLLVLLFGRPALRVLIPVVLVTPTLYLVGWAMAPAQFRPGHLITKTFNILRFLGGDSLAPALLVLAVLAAGFIGLLLLHGPVELLGRHWFSVHVAMMAVPTAAVASWDLLRRNLELAQWEGLHYLWLVIPMLLVTVGNHLASRAVGVEGDAALR